MCLEKKVTASVEEINIPTRIFFEANVHKNEFIKLFEFILDFYIIQ